MPKSKTSGKLGKMKVIKAWAVIEPAWIYSMIVYSAVENITTKSIFPSEYEAKKWFRQLQEYEQKRAKIVPVEIRLLTKKPNL
jgi:hypothetical protein